MRSLRLGLLHAPYVRPLHREHCLLPQVSTYFCSLLLSVDFASDHVVESQSNLFDSTFSQMSCFPH